MTRRVLCCSLVAIAAVLGTAGGASAATTIGQTFPPSIGTLPETLNFQTAVSGNSSYALPSAGVITSFSHIAEVLPDATLALVVLRPAGADYSVVAVTDQKTLAGGVLNTFAARIPAQAGDIIGVLGDTPNLAAASGAALGNDFAGDTLPVSTGATVFGAGLSAFNGYLLDISAVVEADADGDGYGDESQDLCPTQAANQGACDVTGPALTLKFSKTQKTKSSIKLSATSNEAGTFTAATKLTYTATKSNGKRVTKTLRLKTKSGTLTAGGTQTVTLKLTSKAKSKLKSIGKLKAVVTITSTDVYGNKSTKTARITVKRK